MTTDNRLIESAVDEEDVVLSQDHVDDASWTLVDLTQDYC